MPSFEHALAKVSALGIMCGSARPSIALVAMLSLETNRVSAGYRPGSCKTRYVRSTDSHVPEPSTWDPLVSILCIRVPRRFQIGHVP